MKFVSNIPLFSILLGAVLLVSCKDFYNICEQNRTSTANGKFYSIVSGVEVENSPASLVVTVLNGPVATNTSTPPAFFPLNLLPHGDSMSFTIKAGTRPLDTIKLKYTTQLLTLSEDCGQINQFNISSITHTKRTIDSIRIIKPLADQLLGINFRLYY